jgi:cell division septal protein FtsQ
MKGLRKFIVVFLSVTAVAAATVGIYRAVHSPLFLVRVVEITDLPENAPVDAQTLQSLAAVPLDIVNLFDLELKTVEKRLLANDWVKEVRLQKRFPQTLSISVVFREPKAILQNENGSLSYVDTDGRSFGKVNLQFQPDLPILVGMSERLPEALKLIHDWESSSLGKMSAVSSMTWENERGFRLLVTYPLKSKTTSGLLGRAWVDIGQDLAASSEPQVARIARVLDYLSINGIAARQIWADSGKKIVVKTAHGS